MSRKLASGKPASQWVFFEKRFVVPDYDNPKVASRIRWRLFHCPYFGIYVHKWLQPDPRETPHNHPWPFFSLILWGEYYERIAGQGIWDHRYLRRWLNVVPRNRFHSVPYVRSPTWTLMFVGRDRGDWGYLDPHINLADPRYVPFEEHWHSEEFKAAMAERASH